MPKESINKLEIIFSVFENDLQLSTIEKIYFNLETRRIINLINKLKNNKTFKEYGNQI